VATGRILLVEDRESLRRMLERALAAEGYEVVATADGETGMASLAERDFDLVLTDLKLPAASGLDVLAASRAAHPELPVVVLTAYGTVRSAVEAMRLGAVDFLEKPVEIDDLSALVASLLAGDIDEEAFEVPDGPAIVGRHPRMRAALRLLERVAPTDSTVLLTGETGTGKELFARALHTLSKRSGGPFVAVNCAAIPDGLLESELFGHEKGAFTGAHRRRAGRFEQAGGGTLLLDEVGELTSAVQGKVLRVLEERSFERVGGGSTLTTDARLVAATNRDLGAMVDAGSFRSDLFYRLDVFPIELPPLRERPTDLPALARHLLERLAVRHGGAPLKLDEDAGELLASQSWPGNVRQLANLLERAVILSGRPRLTVADLRPLLAPAAADDERQQLRRALQETDGDKRRAAELLGVSYRTVLRRVAEYDLGGYPRYRD
jgi:DNA-binding NtrC family response regulator